jgi:Na+/H+-dicarboxylate symporter
MGVTGTESKPAPVIPILIAMLVGGFTGWLLGPDASLGSVKLLPLFDLIGSLFINLLKMLIVPLILSSVITGVAALGTGPDLGRLGGKTLAFYVITTLIAVLIALMLVNIIEPGVRDGQPVRSLLALTADAAEVTRGVMHSADSSVLDSIRGIVPANIVDAAANTKMLGLVLFSILFGFFLARIPQPHQGTVFGFWQGIFLIMMRMTEFVMQLAPIGVFALIAKVVAVSGFKGAGPLLLFGACVVSGLALFAFVALPILLSTVARVNPWRLFPAMAPALLTAFSTASSSATLPLSLECLERRAKVSERIAGFVMPLGASMNHAGSALYECAAAMFIVQAYGLHLVVCNPVHRGDSRARHVNGNGRYSGGVSGGNRDHPCGRGPASGSDRCAIDSRPAARYGPHRYQCARRFRVCGDRRAARRRDRSVGRGSTRDFVTPVLAADLDDQQRSISSFYASASCGKLIPTVLNPPST